MKKLLLLALTVVSLVQIESIRAHEGVLDSSKIEVIKEFAKTNPKSFVVITVGAGYVSCKIIGSACNLVAKAYESAANAICQEIKVVAKVVSDCPIIMTAGTSACVCWMYNTQFAK